MLALASRKIGAEIHVVRRAQHKAHSATAGRQKIAVLEKLTGSGRDTANPSEPDHPETHWQLKSILDLRCHHIPVEISTGGVAAKFVIRA